MVMTKTIEIRRIKIGLTTLNFIVSVAGAFEDYEKVKIWDKGIKKFDFYAAWGG